MYIPEAFEITDFPTILAFLQQHPFGILTVNGLDGLPVASHLPFLVRNERETLILEGHLARANDLESYLHRELAATMIVNGAHGYVSSSVYEHVNVPTYNYQAVHLSGTIAVLKPAELLEHLKAVVGNFEANRDQPIDFDQWLPEMIESYMQEITGFRLTIFKIEAAFKLSQNRNDDDFDRIVADLQQGNPDQLRLAEEMHQIRKEKR